MTTSCSKKTDILFIDIETYSSEDLTSVGVHKYVEAEDFEIMLIGYAFNDKPRKVIDLKANEDATQIYKALTDSNVIKVAHNTAFERTCFMQALGVDLPPEEWVDTMILSAMNGLPLSLDAVGDALELGNKKLKEGKTLINYFCKPCKPTIRNGGRTRNLPEHDLEKWSRFKTYCGQDVEVERDIFNRLKGYKVTEFERRVWAVDARINERGVLVDQDLALAAIELDQDFKEEHANEMQALTGLDNPNAVAQLKGWLEDVGLEVDSLNKSTVKELKSQATCRTTKRVLELRQMLGKTSTTKYQAMMRSVCKDGRIRGILQYYGAGRTGRWAGRLVQLQNLPQNHLKQIRTVRKFLMLRDFESLGIIFGDIPDVLSQLIRTALIAEQGKTFLVADYSAIEARVIAYLAGEQWRMDVFAGDGKIYEASYAKAFNVPIESVTKGSPERQKGKIMELALGYGGGVNALLAFGADKLGLSETELQELVSSWRLASPMVVNLWQRVENAAKTALENPGRRVTVMRKYRDPSRRAENEAITGGKGYSQDFLAGGEVCVFWRDKDALRCKLPSGRVLSYWQARVDGRAIVFMGQDQTTKRWTQINSWGGKFVENIVQAYARDCLAVALVRLADAGYKIAFHVHDEIIVEADKTASWREIGEIMNKPIEWAPGLLLRADGYETEFYRKD